MVLLGPWCSGHLDDGDGGLLEESGRDVAGDGAVVVVDDSAIAGGVGDPGVGVDDPPRAR